MELTGVAEHTFRIRAAGMPRSSRRGAPAMITMIVAAALAASLLTGCTGRPSWLTDALGLAGATEYVTCKGMVVDSQDAPVAGALVTACRSVGGTYRRGGQIEPVATATSKADGSFSVRVPADLSSVLVVGEKKGLAVGWESLTLSEGKLETTIKLGEQVALAGSVVDEAGSPIRGAKVTMDLRPGVHGSRSRTRLPGHDAIKCMVARTGADGRFVFANVPIGATANLRVEAAGRARLNTASGHRRSGFRPPATDVKLVLPVEARIEAVVVEKETGRPVSGLALLASGYRGSMSHLATCISKRQGRYRWDKLPAGRYRLSLAPPVRGAAEWAAASVEAEAEAGRTTVAPKIELTRGGIAELLITDAEDGKPIPQASVVVSRARRGSYLNSNTEADGIARIRLMPGDYRVQWVSASRYDTSRFGGSITVVAGETARLEVKLEKSPRIRGIVRDQAGKPLGGATVSALPDRGHVVADAAGKFEIWQDFRHWSRRRSFLLVGRHEGRNLAAAVEVADPSKAIDLRLLPALTVTGQVVDPDGKPIRGARVSVLFDRSRPDAPRYATKTQTDAGGRYRISALPPGRGCALRFEADGHATADLSVDGLAAQVVLRPFHTIASPAVAREIPVPDAPGAWAIWGATGRDRRGHIWFAVATHQVETPSAHLFEFIPRTGEVIARGDVVSELKRLGLLRDGESQMKIHTKMIQAGEYLYFASMDEDGEDEVTEKLPTWGGHLWRLRLRDNRWEHLLTTPEALIAVAGTARHIYAMGYFGHVLYQYDIDTGRTRSVRVGSMGGHVSRNILCDRRGHAYVPRIRAAERGGPVATLVEYDTSLKEIGETPLKYYLRGRPSQSHGIIGHQMLPDGSIAFTTHSGWLSLIQPAGDDGPAKVTDIGWFRPTGPTYAPMLFADSTGRFLMGAVRGGWDQPLQWVVYDLKTRTHSVGPFQVSQPVGLDVGRSLLYGSRTRDDDGNCYIVGTQPKGGRGEGSKPIVLQVRPARIPALEAGKGIDLPRATRR